MKYQYWLSNIPGIGSRTIRRLLAQAGSAEELYFLKEKQVKKLFGLSERQTEAFLARRADWDLDENYEKLGARGITFLSYEMENYPAALREIADAPYSLYVKGRMPDFSRKRVAIVGARMCSEYGRAMAEQIGKSLALCGAQVISGLARGIDSCGHTGALMGGGTTFAVLGCGVDVCYPRSGEALYREILEKDGGILSEYPPDTAPYARLFPARNRIISALSDVVTVVEARERSGSLITADCALEQGKDVYAVPGRATDALSFGCNALIRQGAGMINSVENFLLDLGLSVTEEKNQENFKKLSLAKDESLVYACLSLRPKSMEELIAETGCSASEAADVLQRLIRRKAVTETFKNYYIRKI